MVKLDANKDGNGNIVISEDSFEYLLNCLDSQKFKPASNEQDIIDNFNYQCRRILNQKYLFETCEDNYFLYKKYPHQSKIVPWSGEDVGVVYELFKDTKRKKHNIDKSELIPLTEDDLNNIPLDINVIGKYKNGWFAVEEIDEPWLIERTIRCDYNYLTISEDGQYNRPWKNEEIEKISMAFEGFCYSENKSNKEKIWKEQLDDMDITVIENFLRKTKIEKL